MTDDMRIYARDVSPDVWLLVCDEADEWLAQARRCRAATPGVFDDMSDETLAHQLAWNENAYVD